MQRKIWPIFIIFGPFGANLSHKNYSKKIFSPPKSFISMFSETTRAMKPIYLKIQYMDAEILSKTSVYFFLRHPVVTNSRLPLLKNTVQRQPLVKKEQMKIENTKYDSHKFITGT